MSDLGHCSRGLRASYRPVPDPGEGATHKSLSRMPDTAAWPLAPSTGSQQTEQQVSGHLLPKMQNVTLWITDIPHVHARTQPDWPA